MAHKIPERFPELRFGFIEASASWVPYVLHHLQRASGARLNAGGDADASLDWGPNLFRDYRLYVAAEADEDLPYLLTHIGEDHIIMGSDYGHQDQSHGMVADRKEKSRKRSFATIPAGYGLGWFRVCNMTLTAYA